MTRIEAPDDAGIAHAAAVLAAGGVVGLPTETVYGLAASVDDPRAIARVFSAKDRPLFDPLIAHVDVDGGGIEKLEATGLVDLSGFVAAGRDAVDRLVRAFWPGPLTLVVPRSSRVPDLATGGLPTVAVRAPSHPVARRLIREVGPLVAPSANRFGRISPTRARDVVAELGDRVDLVLDGGRCAVGLESTVVAVAPNGAAILLRPGAIAREDLEKCLGAQVEMATASERPQGPGQLASHYAPRTPLMVLRGGVWPLATGPVGLLVMSGDAQHKAAEASRRLGVPVQAIALGADLPEIARNLFQAMRELDEAGLTLLLAEPSPSTEGLGFAIADRLSRASVR